MKTVCAVSLIQKNVGYTLAGTRLHYNEESKLPWDAVHDVR